MTAVAARLGASGRVRRPPTAPRARPDGDPSPIGGRVILGLQGGLGNQLFQWAFATALQHEGVDVRVDTVRCRGDRPLVIGPLLGDFSRGSRIAGLARVTAQRISPGVVHTLREREFGYDEALVERARTGHHLVLGYFQSPRYFASVAGRVRASLHDFLGGQVTDAGHRFLASLDSEETVAVHVRRGDYVTNPTAAAHHGALGKAFYDAALESVRRRRDAQVVWFSDDTDWVRANLAIPQDQICQPQFSSSAGGEIALMAACRTRIIANSSFGWWAGWLGRQPDNGGHVVAPAAWFTDSTVSTDDLIPTTWVRQQ